MKWKYMPLGIAGAVLAGFCLLSVILAIVLSILGVA